MAGFGKVVDMPVSKQFSIPAVVVVRRLNSIKTTTSKTSAKIGRLCLARVVRSDLHEAQKVPKFDTDVLLVPLLAFNRVF